MSETPNNSRQLNEQPSPVPAHIPVLFCTSQGIHLRTLRQPSSTYLPDDTLVDDQQPIKHNNHQYRVTLCDHTRWSSANRRHRVEIGLTPDALGISVIEQLNISQRSLKPASISSVAPATTRKGTTRQLANYQSSLR